MAETQTKPRPVQGELMAPEPTGTVPAPTMGTAVTPMEMLRIAVERGADLDMLERLMSIQERWEANEAKKAFVTALNAFKADPPTVVKNKKASFGAGKTEYDYATLAQVANVIAPALARQGLSHTWKTDQTETGFVSVTCTLTHERGHAESVMMKAAADNSGAKNAIQALGSTVTYLQRYTLLAITGLAAQGQDDDGHDFGTLISDGQKAELIALQQEVRADTAAFLKWLNVSTLDALPAAKFQMAKDALAKKRDMQKRG